MKLFTKTFGCQMNFADSDEMTRHFRRRGFQTTQDSDAADAILVNTCTVRDLAEHKAGSYIGRLAEWKEKGPERLLIVSGCAAERAKDDFRRRFPMVDLIVGAKDIEGFPAELDRALDRRPELRRRSTEASLSERALVPEDFAQEAGSPVVRYVTIMRGCNYSCSYCIVPSVRGREIYRPVDEILADVRARVAEGAREIWLLGQTVNSYRPAVKPREGYDFPDLLRDVAAVPGLARVRFTSPHPHYLTPKLIEAMAETPGAGEHLHLPVQSGSDDVLRRMRRNYTRASYISALRALRAAVPGISITTDLIVGFPGETEADFEATLSLVDEANFDSAYCFKYSPRPGTEAAALPDDVPAGTKDIRVNRLLELSDRRGREKAASLVGTVQEMLVEEDLGLGLWRGKTRGPWRVRLESNAVQLGDVIRVKITGNHSRDLHAELITAENTVARR